jgi:hypothetical protein
MMMTSTREEIMSKQTPPKQVVFSLIPLIDKEGNIWKPYQFFLMSPASAKTFIKNGNGVEANKASHLSTSALPRFPKAVKAPPSTDYSSSFLGKISQNQVEWFIAEELPKIAHVIDYLKDK